MTVPAGARHSKIALRGPAFAGLGAQGASTRSAASSMTRRSADSSAQNVVRPYAARKRTVRTLRIDEAPQGQAQGRHRHPRPDEMRAIIARTLKGPLAAALVNRDLYRPARIRIARPAMGGIDFRRGALQVCQRADHWNKIGPPKSEAGERTVPLPPMVVSALREWKLVCPKGELVWRSLVPVGRIQTRFVIVDRGLRSGADSGRRCNRSRQCEIPGFAQPAALLRAWCINRRVDSGLELPLKVVQAQLGHASIQMTADTYGHLFPRGDDGAELAAAEKAFLG